MIRRPRLLVAPAAVAAVVGTALLTGTHGDPAPDVGATDPSAPAARRLVTAEEFCTAFALLAGAREAHLSAPSPEAVAALKDAAGAVGELAPGTAMSETARAGVDYVVAAFRGLADDATSQDVVEADDLATVRDDSHAQALSAFIAESCGPSPVADPGQPK